MDKLSFPVEMYTESPSNHYVNSPNRDLERLRRLNFGSCDIEVDCASSDGGIHQSSRIHSVSHSCTLDDVFDNDLAKEDKTDKSDHGGPADREAPAKSTDKISNVCSSDTKHTDSECKGESTHREGGSEEEEMRVWRQSDVSVLPSIMSSTMPLIPQIPPTVAADTGTSGIGSDITTEDEEADTSQTITVDLRPQEAHNVNDKHVTPLMKNGYVYSGASSTGTSGYLDINSEL